MTSSTVGNLLLPLVLAQSNHGAEMSIFSFILLKASSLFLKAEKSCSGITKQNTENKIQCMNNKVISATETVIT